MFYLRLLNRLLAIIGKFQGTLHIYLMLKGPCKAPLVNMIKTKQLMLDTFHNIRKSIDKLDYIDSILHIS